MFLLIDTSTKNAGIALYSNSELTHKQLWSSQYNHSQELFVALEKIFEQSNTSVSDVTGIGLALGPGGYSSVRSGVSVGKTIAYAQKIPIYGHNTLDIEAGAYRQEGMKTCSVIEAGKSVLSYAVYNETGIRINPDHVSDINTLLGLVDDNTLICGEGVMVYEQDIKNLNKKMIKWDSQALRLETLGRETSYRHLNNESDALESIEPIYARPPSIG